MSVEPSLANQFRAEALEHRREQLVVAWVAPGEDEKGRDIPTEEARKASKERRHELCGTAPVQRAKKAATKAQARKKPAGKKRKLATA